MRTIPYREADHGDFDEEWLPQRGVSGWWYVTGYAADRASPERLFSFQVTFIRPRVFCISPSVLQLAVTEVSGARHFFIQRAALLPGSFAADEASVSFGKLARLERRQGKMTLTARCDTFSFSLELTDRKGGVWHGDEGVLVMGLPDSKRERTVYYSRPNLGTTGSLSIAGTGGAREEISVTGKSWFDRQWGPFGLVNPKTHWEWFSLRFFDDEEVMLFAFPQDAYYDGTYFDKERRRRRVRDYSYQPLEIVEAAGYRFSKGWDVVLPGIKEERYRIRPLMDGQLNLAYFELLAEVLNPAGARVGMCVAELLPGARTQGAIALRLFNKA